LPERVDLSSTDLTWSQTLSYQQRLIGTTTFTPNLSMSGKALQTNKIPEAGSLVSAPTRLSFGAGLKTDIYGLWPGVGGFSAIRHKLSPGFDYSYAPAVTQTQLQNAVFGRGEFRAKNEMRIRLNQTFEAKRETEDPEEENEELGLHGRLAFLPAKNVVANAGWEGEQYVVRVHGKMREAVFFGTNLELTREISTVLGEKSIHIYDRIENLSVDPSPLMFVYHCNPGFPVLDSGTRLLINSEKTTEWLEDKEVGPEVYQVAKPPQEEAHDDVFVHRPIADADGNVHVGLVNDGLGLGLYWKFPIAEIPLVNQWQHFHRGTYVTGVEPGNVSMLGRVWNRREGHLKHIQPGEVREFHLEIGVLDGAEEIGEFERRF